MARAKRSMAALIALLLGAGCGPRLVPLAAPAARGDSGLELVAEVAGGADPLPAAGGGLAFSGVARASGAFVAAAAEPWARRHRDARPGGWRLLVELTQARARLSDGALTVELETRVTLSARAGQLHLGQTRGYCRETDTFSARAPAAVAARCLERMGRDLAGWLEGVSP
ncbi:MAG TPA: hypothetical protein VGQ83_25440 [Polyangia bacterium]|jgi:hypothetical protein